LCFQVLLGAASWVVKYGMPGWTRPLIGETGHFNRASDAASAAIVAGHGAVGALIVAICVVIALDVGRRTSLPKARRRGVTNFMAGALG
jgi:hypothetical protein